MRQKLRSVLCLFALLLVLLPATAGANSLPSSFVYLNITGPKDTITHVAVLSTAPPEEPRTEPPAALTAALPDGWQIWDCTIYDSTAERLSFWGIGFPDTFRAALVFLDGTVQITGDAVRTRSMQTFTVDAQTGAITTQPAWVGLLLQFACTCSVTMAVEAAVLLLFRFPWRKNWKPFLLVNLATQILMTLTFGRTLIYQGGYAPYFAAFGMEIVIFILEALAYAYFLHGHTRPRRVLYALAANAASFVIGIAWIAPVYSSIAGLM